MGMLDKDDYTPPFTPRARYDRARTEEENLAALSALGEQCHRCGRSAKDDPPCECYS